MKSIRNEFAQISQRLFFRPKQTGPIPIPTSRTFRSEHPEELAANTKLPVTDPTMTSDNKKERHKFQMVLWVFLVVGLLILTAVLVTLSFAITSYFNAGILISAILWAVLFGICILFFLPAKLVATTFGGLLGIGVNEAVSASGMLSKLNIEITAVANQIGHITSPSNETTDPFIGVVIWCFIIVMGLVCLPAFFREE